MTTDMMPSVLSDDARCSVVETDQCYTWANCLRHQALGESSETSVSMLSAGGTQSYSPEDSRILIVLRKTIPSLGSHFSAFWWETDLGGEARERSNGDERAYVSTH
jgi:hypothetical protein